MFRRKYIHEGGKVEDLKFKTPLYPVLPIIGLTLNTVVLISLAFDSEQRLALYCGIPFMAVCVIVYHLYVKSISSQKTDRALNLFVSKSSLRNPHRTTYNMLRWKNG